MSDKVREEFEEWAASVLLHGKVSGDQIKGMREGKHYSSYNQYTAGVLSGAWHGWEASRAELVIVLPEEQPGYMYYAPDVAEAIQAAGVTIK